MALPATAPLLLPAQVLEHPYPYPYPHSYPNPHLHPHSCPYPLLTQVLDEFLDTEGTYLADMRLVIKEFVIPLEPLLPPSLHDALFANLVGEIEPLHAALSERLGERLHPSPNPNPNPNLNPDPDRKPSPHPQPAPHQASGWTPPSRSG